LRLEGTGTRGRASLVTFEIEINGRVRRVDVERTGAGFEISLDGRQHRADVTVVGGLWSLILSPDGNTAPRRSYEVAIAEDRTAAGRLTVQVGGRVLVANVGRSQRGERGGDAGAAASGPQAVTAPMPGRVVKLLVQPGDAVAARQPVVVVEAMKMENELRAAGAGTVTEIRVAEGALVDAGAVLAIIE
jgi:biotin carboxyl carrier protein